MPGEGMQPPLVYVLAAPLLGNAGDRRRARRCASSTRAMSRSTPTRAAKAAARRSRSARTATACSRTDGSLEPLRVLRSTSLVFGLLTVILTFAAVWRLARDARFALLAGALLAFNPQFLFSSALLLERSRGRGDRRRRALGDRARARGRRARPMRRHYVVGAVVIALGMLTKSSTLPGLAVAAVTLVAIDPRPRREVLIDTASPRRSCSRLGGPYLVWAAEHRGGLFGWSAMFASSASMMRPERFGGMAGPTSPACTGT